ncbi:MAG: hypothetical protein ABIR32_16035 [Ilumatobacteraceae bacterium]
MNQLPDSDPTISPSVDRRIARHLGAHAGSLDLTEANLGAVMTRARNRRNHRRTIAGAVTAIVVAAGSVVAIDTLSQTDGRSISNDSTPNPTDNGVVPSTDATEPAPAATGAILANRIESNLVWNVVVPDSAQALGETAFGSTQTEPPFVAVSSAPGQTDTEWTPTMYRSDDAISWTQSGTTPDVPLTAFDSYGGAMYSFSTAAATAPIAAGGAGDAVIESSIDGGDTWQTQVLPLDLRSLADAHGVAGVPFDSKQVVSGPAGTIAVGKISIAFDPDELGIPSGTYIDRQDADGMYFRPRSCSDGMTSTTVEGTTPATEAPEVPCDATADSVADDIGFRSWTELGVDQAVIDAIDAPPFVFVKAPGSTEFVVAAFPLLPAGETLANPIVIATSDGFAVVGSVTLDNSATGSAVLYRSTDGVSWIESSVPIEWPQAFGQLADGSFVAIGQANVYTGGTTVAFSPDGTAWTLVDLDGVLTSQDGRSATVMSFSPGIIDASGITLAATIHTDPYVENGPISITRDGITVTQTSDVGAYDFTDAGTGEELGSWTFGADGVETVNVRHNDAAQTFELLTTDGSVRFSLTQQDSEALFIQTQNDEGYLQPVLLHSTNGLDWSREDVRSIVGRDVYRVVRLQSSSGTVIATVLDPLDKLDGGGNRALVLVGTPKS